MTVKARKDDLTVVSQSCYLRSNIPFTAKIIHRATIARVLYLRQKGANIKISHHLDLGTSVYGLVITFSRLGHQSINQVWLPIVLVVS